MDKLYFDTYALIEIFKGNENYSKYKNISPITSMLNLYEFYYCLRRQGIQKDVLLIIFNRLRDFCVEIKPEIIIEASEMKLIMERDLSYADVLGYAIAKRMNVKFLTGDIQFKDLLNVEFMK